MKRKQLDAAPGPNEGKIWKNYRKFVSGLHSFLTISRS
jgi:hypothetical protein